MPGDSLVIDQGSEQRIFIEVVGRLVGGDRGDAAGLDDLVAAAVGVVADLVGSTVAVDHAGDPVALVVGDFVALSGAVVISDRAAGGVERVAERAAGARGDVGQVSGGVIGVIE